MHVSFRLSFPPSFLLPFSFLAPKPKSGKTIAKENWKTHPKDSPFLKKSEGIRGHLNATSQGPPGETIKAFPHSG
jgi:hypothetical protein